VRCADREMRLARRSSPTSLPRWVKVVGSDRRADRQAKPAPKKPGAPGGNRRKCERCGGAVDVCPSRILCSPTMSGPS
jgi:ferredoxin